jgi:AraC family transcriptional regulator
MIHCNIEIGSHFYLDDAPTIRCCPLGGAAATVARLEDENPIRRLTTPFDHEDALLVTVQLGPLPGLVVIEDGVEHAPFDLGAGESVFFDLRRDPRIRIAQPYSGVAVHIPRAMFDALEAEVHSPPVGDIRYDAGAAIDDERIRNLGSALYAELADPDPAFRLFVSQVSLALVTHVAARYGGFVANAGVAKGGLAPWQMRRAQEMLGANLDGNLLLEDIARECGLSVSHFSRAFRDSVGLPPHRWLIKRRVETAKSLMREGHAALSEIALQCGFADQSHFTRAFSRETGASPGQWRRCIAG